MCLEFRGVVRKMWNGGPFRPLRQKGFDGRSPILYSLSENWDSPRRPRVRTLQPALTNPAPADFNMRVTNPSKLLDYALYKAEYSPDSRED